MNLKPSVVICFILGMLFQHIPCSGQWSITDDLYVQASYRPGLVMPEYSLFTYLVDEYVRSFECTITRRSSGKNLWHQIYRYPEIGIAFQYATLGNKEIFGHEISIYPFYNIYLWEPGRFSLLHKGGLGLGLASKKYNPDHNPYNVAIGSHLNLHFNFELNAQWRLWDKLTLVTGLGFDHLSNGNFGEPNLGINYFTLHGGIRYLAGDNREREKQILEKHIPVTTTAFILSAGTKNARALQSKKYFISSLSFEVKRKLWRIFSPGIGADLFYDAATSTEMWAFARDTPWRSIHDFKTGIHLSQELVYHKFSIAVQEGFYLFLTDQAFDNPMYHRLILRHQIPHGFFLQLSMKSHAAVLDYLEFGIGYSGKS